MARQGPPIDWNAVERAREDGRLMELLHTLPRARWAERDQTGLTLLHHAARGPNVAALVALIQSGLDVNARGCWLFTPAHEAASYAQAPALEVLCAAGADLRGGETPLDQALIHVSLGGDDACARVLVANGVRLSTVSGGRRQYITPALEAFERGVLRCRSAVAALLRVKRVSGQLMVCWDRYLLKQMALDVWATRSASEWQYNCNAAEELDDGTRTIMARADPPIDWDAVDEASNGGRLMEVLRALPRTRWVEVHPDRRSILHFAARDGNVAALVALIQSGLDVNTRDCLQRTPALDAAIYNQPRALEVMCAAGADLRAYNDDGCSLLDSALANEACALVLLANGARLRTVDENLRRYITAELVAFERGVLRCRAAVVALLGVKRISGQLLVRWDRYLLKQMALDLWATRCAKEWQRN